MKVNKQGIQLAKSFEGYDKHYSDMNRNEKREYKRFLDKNNIWDGAVILERLQNKKFLQIR
jgi:hypothetical protein